MLSDKLTLLHEEFNNYHAMSVERTDYVRIYVAGDYDTVRRACRDFCFSSGAVVSVSRNEVIYQGGHEPGAEILLVNYPKRPTTSTELFKTASRLAKHVLEECRQNSSLLVTEEFTYWITRQ